MLANQRITILIDSGATHNFINKGFLARKGLTTKYLRDSIWLLLMILQYHLYKNNLATKMTLRDYSICEDFYLVRLGDNNMVLGVQ